ncbi:MAG TPA: sigma 54-interacting transcriptional regulator [Polyangiaceae bacterium]|nr:sigma 54-interacting transcriptional regulator [Polyangiaceae bacterium]
MALSPGDLLQGRYRVGTPLGQGGMGSVFQAREEPEGLELTVKQLRLDAPDLLESFRGEFALLSRVSAPHLLRVVDFGSERLRGEPHHYYVAERVDGVTLGERAQRTAGAELLRAVGDAVLGLSALHEAGIRHGDFTPANVLVDRSGGGVLIDLGCARPFGVTEHLAGTERYLAPELLEGRAGDARSDLYGVGRTLESLFAGGARPPAAVERLMARLLRTDPAARPLDCAEVLAALGRKARPLGKSWTPARLLGREAEVARFESWLSALLSGDSGPRVFGLWGGAGMGSSRLLRELTWRAQVRLSVLRGHTEQPVGRLLATALGLAEVVGTRRGVLAAVSVLAERAEPLLLVVEDAERLPSEEQELLVSLVRSLGPRGNLALLVSSRAAFEGDGVSSLECGALPSAAVEAWTSPLLTEKRARELGRQSQGSPRRIEQLLAEQLGALPEAKSAESGKAGKASLGELSAPERETLALIYSQTGEVFAHSLGLNWSELDPLLERRLVERDGEELRLSGAAREAVARGALSAAELAKAHLLAAGWFALQEAERGGGTRAARVIHHLVRGGDVARAEALLSAESTALRGGPRQVGKLLLPLVDASRRSQVLLELAGLLLELGQPRAAVRAAARAARHGKGPELRRRAALLASDGLTRLGRPARAELLLGGLWAAGGQAVSGPDGAEVLQRLARARLSRGDYAGARDTAERALEEGPAALVAGLTHETLGVACAYLGDAERAQAELNQALSLLAEQARPRDRSRIQSHRAMVAFRAGRVEPALADYAGALALAEEHDLDDLIATGLLNLGTAEQQAGLWGEALRHYQRGVTFASAASRTSTELTLEFNLANLHAEIGAFERAEEALSRLELKSAAAKLSHFAPGIALIRAEIRLARAEPEAAEKELLAAERLLQGRAQPRELFEVRLRRVDVELLRDKPQEAERKLKALASSQPDDAAADLSLGLELARARVDAALGRTNALERLESARVRAQREGLLALEATLETELSQAAQRLGSVDDARARTERARRLWDRIGQGLPSGLTSLFWRHARRAPLVEPSRSFATAAEAAAGGHEAEAYRRLLSLNRRLNSSLSLERVLEYAVQAALDLTEAERAFLLLTSASADGAGLSAEVAVARSTDPALPEGEGPSQSIVRRTLEREEPILTTDAQGDPRFAGQGSVHALRLKSVLSVPVLSPSGVLGVLYVDCRVQRGRFSEGERALLLAFADQLALAINNARLHQELERKGAELARQKHAVEQLSRGQAREIERLKREVQTQRQNLELRYDYSQIVGRGPAMRAVLERLDRVIDSEASVLVLGESGTGKELVARAIHWNGPRKSGPFLGLNCAALPESLLESELFGHVRGAFTGADRDKQGLLQAAAGGTLFLDELGELSPATQAKLLRVLQEREVRPLGSEKSVPLDVRLLAATHRELDRAMAEGKFREDLYYRIAVVTVQLPPLRERPEDLPVLCEKILQRLGQDAGKQPPQLGQDALRRLSAHPFPGNVRELENVLTRAFVLAPGSKLRAEDLDLGGRRAPAPRARSRRDFEADEKDRILAALRAARWNVSVVSRTLGIPRNTLYRKLQRYGLERAV